MRPVPAPVRTHALRHSLVLARGRLVRRYKRFLADIQTDDGRALTVHCPNSGSMRGLDAHGLPVVVSDSANDARRLRWTLEAVQVDDGAGRVWVGVNTGLPNHQVGAWLARGGLPGVPAATPFRREVPYGTRSRIDILAMPHDAPPVYIEVKNTTLARRGHDGALEAQFPDAVTERGQKHLREMMERVDQGDRAMLVPYVNRDDCVRFAPAADIDPTYAALFQEAIEAGVEVVPLQVRHSVRSAPSGLVMSTRPARILPVFLG